MTGDLLDVPAAAMVMWLADHWEERDVSVAMGTIYLPIHEEAFLRSCMASRALELRHRAAENAAGRLRLLEHVTWHLRVGEARRPIDPAAPLPPEVHTWQVPAPHFLDCQVRLLTVPAPPQQWWRPTREGEL